MSESGDDRELLTALIDGELAEPARSALLERLKVEPSLRERHDALLAARAGLDDVFGSLLAEAPVARLAAAIPPSPPARRNVRRFGVESLAAGFLIGAIIGAALMGAVAWRDLHKDEGWTGAVVNYMRLYAPETFAALNPDPQLTAIELSALGERLGLPLKADNVALEGLKFRTAFGLVYEGSPLGEIAFTDASGAPNLICILADGSPATPLNVQRRDEYEAATWSSHGKQFLVLGPAGAPVARWAEAFSARL